MLFRPNRAIGKNEFDKNMNGTHAVASEFASDTEPHDKRRVDNLRVQFRPYTCVPREIRHQPIGEKETAETM